MGDHVAPTIKIHEKKQDIGPLRSNGNTKTNKTDHKPLKKFSNDFTLGWASRTVRRVVIWKFFPDSRLEYEILGISFFAQNLSKESPVDFLSWKILLPIASRISCC